DHPATVPARELDRLRARENERGVVVLDPEPVFPFSDGDLVRVTEGPFTGLSGIYQCDEAHTRVRVLLEYLGRKTRVAVDDAALQAVV
ncbi:MAG TPA: transcriptional activator RfaH, partial [Candidatus Paceibacterota bacterium]|nr:transcriptional activator RfaH [Candidatus Paceibacterota bacterium]